MTQGLPPNATTVPLHLTVDPYWDLLTAIAFGRVDDGLPPAQCPVLEEDERIEFLLDGPDAGPGIVALACEEEGSFETDAREYLRELSW